MRLRLLVEFDLVDFIWHVKPAEKPALPMLPEVSTRIVLFTNGKSCECKACDVDLPIGKGIKASAIDIGFLCDKCWKLEKRYASK